MAMSMADGETTDWGKVSSSYTKDESGKVKFLKNYFKDVNE
jgi:hypothetical protein